MKSTAVTLFLLITISAVRAQDSIPALDQQAFDRAVRAQDDLYLAVNGKWLEKTRIPSDKSNYGSFTALQDLSQSRIRDIIQRTAEQDHPFGSDAQKIGDYYRSYMDENKLNELGYEPLKLELARIDAIHTVEDVVRYFGYAQQLGVNVPVGMTVDQDDKHSSENLTAVVQSGITLPDRDFYLEQNERFAEAKRKLKEYISNVFALCGLSGDAADQILELEGKLAEVQWELTELRDVDKRYNKFEVAKLSDVTPWFAWGSFFTAAGIPDVVTVNVMTPSYFTGLESIVRDTPVPVWRAYLRFHLIDSFAPVLSRPLADAHFDLHARVLQGTPERQPRWKEAVDAVAGASAGDFGVLGDALGKLYVAEYFGEEAQARMAVLVENLLAAFRQSIDELSWMTDTTKQRAQDKLAKITTKIGFTEKWRDYSELEIKPDDLFGNTLRSRRIEYQRVINKLGKPVDPLEWGMTPQTVNAYYNPGRNEIVFPAAILQPPFFNTAADDAVNYGGIGAVIGHEISHGFDDQGSKYDGDGNLRNWWTEKDRYDFEQLTARLVDQYNDYQPLPGKHVNGALTLGENIADVSGLAIAYKAYRISLDGSTPPKIDGFTSDQRFFMGWSQVWRRKYRDAEMIQRLLVDPHAPSWYRANGPIINIDAFYDAFDVQPEDRLYRPPEERIKIW